MLNNNYHLFIIEVLSILKIYFFYLKKKKKLINTMR